MPPLVSVVIPCFNNAKWVADAINSCVSQEYRPLEVIVVDDGSTDDSALMISDLAEVYPEIVHLQREPNRGAPVARNIGGELASGEFLTFLDADDYFRPGAIQTLVDAMGEGVDISYGQACLVDEVGNFLSIKDHTPTSADWVVSMVENAPCCPVLFRRRVISACNWDPELPCEQDYGLHVNCAIRGFAFRFVPVEVAAIRQHKSSTRISQATHNSDLALEVFIKLHLGFQEQLSIQGTLNANRRAAIQYSLLHDAISLWRHGMWSRSKQVFDLIDTHHAKFSSRFTYLSYHGIAVMAGLRASYAAWCCRRLVRHFNKVGASPL